MAYRWIGEAVAEGLATLGVPVRVVGVDEAHAAQRRTDPRTSRAARACFGGLSPFEVVGPDDRKLVGLSQVRRRSGSLFQCGIPMEFDAALLAELLEPDAAEAAELASALDASAAGLRTWLPGVGHDEVVEAVEAALTRREGVRLVPDAA
jgi:lipoate-protein ligase A